MYAHNCGTIYDGVVPIALRTDPRRELPPLSQTPRQNGADRQHNILGNFNGESVT
ncbi:hypothetical protein [Oscillatoria acuminata]|uniref:hypothetical protein n=1 Tax=Oscillatoria acuminata TaxID=118323 RepID=UPI0012EADC53|nr:hypothetical protein [Oscillatoria acuminata]